MSIKRFKLIVYFDLNKEIFKEYLFDNYIEAYNYLNKMEELDRFECYKIVDEVVLNFGCCSKNYCPERSKCKRCDFNPVKKYCVSEMINENLREKGYINV